MIVHILSVSDEALFVFKSLDDLHAHLTEVVFGFLNDNMIQVRDSVKLDILQALEYETYDRLKWLMRNHYYTILYINQKEIRKSPTMKSRKLLSQKIKKFSSKLKAEKALDS